MALFLERIAQAAERAPDSEAIVIGRHAISHGELRALCGSAVARLRDLGIGPGEVVGLTMTQSPLHLVTVLALARLGALMVPLSTSLGASERSAIIGKFAVATLVADRPVAADGCRVVLLQSLARASAAPAPEDGHFVPAADTPLRIALTSGTTAGIPKGVLQTHATFTARLERQFCGEPGAMRVIPPNFAITISLGLSIFALMGGGTVVIPLRHDSASFFDAIRRHRVNTVPLPPSHLARMLTELPERGPAFPGVTHLRFLGATPSRALLERARERFSPHLFLPYAIGEIGTVCMAPPEILARVAGTTGALCPGARLEVIDAAGRPAPAGATGEIRVAIDGMPRDYHDPDAGDGTRFRDGWFYPGDRGRVSAEGFVFIEGRSDDIINMGGRKLAPGAAEEILEEFPGVREAGVFVAGEGRDGPQVAAAVVAAGALDWRALRAHGQRRLEVTAPARYFEVSSLPRNSMGKIMRGRLAQWVGEEGKERAAS